MSASYPQLPAQSNPGLLASAQRLSTEVKSHSIPGSAAGRITLGLLLVTLLTSRIGISVGSSQISIAGPMVLAVAAWGVYTGSFEFQRARLGLYMLIVALSLASCASVVSLPQRLGVGPSWTSLAQFLFLTSLLTVGFKKPLDERIFYDGVMAVLAVIAIAGILQFFLQFIGVSIFTFGAFLPEALSFEKGFNVSNPIGTTHFFKSNGFFLLEASMFSQFSALGLCIEILIARRMRYIALMLTALIVSLSGTGWIILVTFLVSVSFGLKGRGVLVAVTTVCVLGVAMAVLAFAAPDFYASFVDRIGEFSAPGSSGHARFVAPVWALADVFWREPWALLTGAGAGIGERLGILPYEQSMNTPIKIIVELGLPVLVTYIFLLITGPKSRSQYILIFPSLVMILLTGNYSQNPPVLYPILLICCIPTLIVNGTQEALQKTSRLSDIVPRIARPRSNTGLL